MSLLIGMRQRSRVGSDFQNICQITLMSTAFAKLFLIHQRFSYKTPARTESEYSPLGQLIVTCFDSPPFVNHPRPSKTCSVLLGACSLARIEIALSSATPASFESHSAWWSGGWCISTRVSVQDASLWIINRPGISHCFTAGFGCWTSQASRFLVVCSGVGAVP